VAVKAAVSLQPLTVQLRISQSRHVFLFSSFCCLFFFFVPRTIPHYQTPLPQIDRRRQPTSSSKLLRLIISLLHTNPTSLLFSSLLFLALFNIKLASSPVYQTACFLFLSLFCSSVYPHSLLFCFLSLFLLASLPPLPP